MSASSTISRIYRTAEAIKEASDIVQNAVAPAWALGQALHRTAPLSDLPKALDAIAAQVDVAVATALAALQQGCRPASKAEIAKAVTLIVSGIPSAWKHDTTGWADLVVTALSQRRVSFRHLSEALETLQRESVFLPALAEFHSAVNEAESQDRCVREMIEEAPTRLTRAREYVMQELLDSRSTTRHGVARECAQLLTKGSDIAALSFPPEVIADALAINAEDERRRERRALEASHWTEVAELPPSVPPPRLQRPRDLPPISPASRDALATFKASRAKTTASPELSEAAI